MAVQLKNNVTGFIASGISSTTTSIVLQTGQGASFPSLNPVQYFYATLVDAAGNLEIVKATARAGDTLTVVRGQDGTAARAFPALSRIELRVNAGTIYEVIDASISSTPLVISNIASVIRVAEDIDNVNAVAENLEDIQDVADNAFNINLVSNNMPNVVAVGSNIDKVIAVADNETNINLVANNEENIDIVAENIENVAVVGTFITDVRTVADDLNEPISEIQTVADNIAIIDVVGQSIDNVNAVGNNIVDVITVADDLTGANNIGTVADNIDNVNAVGNNIVKVVAVADNETNINAVADNETNINTVATNIANVNTVATNIDNVNTVAGIAGDIEIVADNVIDVTNFADVYLGPRSSAPSTRTDGDPLVAGDLYFNTSDTNLYIWSGASWLLASSRQVAQTFYVTKDGNDLNIGTTLGAPLATVGAAVTKMLALAPLQCVTIVHPGEYEVDPDTVVPANCALYGYDVRVTTLKLPSGQEQNNMFQLSNGCKVRGFTFSGLQHEAAPNYASTSLGLAAVAETEYFTVGTQLYKKVEGFAEEVTYDYPPKKGFAFVFKPGEVLTRSPYIADCSQLHNFSQTQMRLPIDREAGNPLMPRGGGNLRADGSVLSPSSPLRSVVVDSFTAINPNGYGYLVTRNALVQLVSVFTNWSRFAIWAHDGGQVTVSNSNITFGDYSLVTTGFRRTPRIESEGSNTLAVYTSQATAIQAARTTIINTMYSTLASEFPAVASFTAEQEAFTKRDAGTYLDLMCNDLNSAQDRGAQTFVKGLFNWNGGYVFDSSLLAAFLRSFDLLVAGINGLGASTAAAMPMVNYLNGLIKTNLSTPPLVGFPSVVESNGHQFSYAGTGVNYNSLPFSQRGTGETPDPTSTWVEINGGRVYATFTTERGDSYLGKDIRVDFERNTIEGQAFSRGVQNITLPLIIGLGA